MLGVENSLKVFNILITKPLLDISGIAMEESDLSGEIYQEEITLLPFSMDEGISIADLPTQIQEQ